MRFLRFLLNELVIRGVLFAVLGTVVLASLYFLSIGATPDKYLEAGRSFLLMLTGSSDFSSGRAGFSAMQIIQAGAVVTLPLALISLLFLILFALVGASTASAMQYLSNDHGRKGPLGFVQVGNFVAALLATVPLFVGFWIMSGSFGQDAPFLLIALVTVLVGGLGWDATRFLVLDMKRQLETTHTTVFSTIGQPIGSFFPLPGTFTGYLLSSSFPRFIPYIAGKVPAIIGGVTLAEIIFNFPGLGINLMNAMVRNQTDLLVASVFVLLAINGIVTFVVKTVLFVMYPRWYEKAI